MAKRLRRGIGAAGMAGICMVLAVFLTEARPAPTAGGPASDPGRPGGSAGAPEPAPPPGVGNGAPPVLVERNVYAMGTRLRVRAWAASRERALADLEAAVEAVEAEERLLSSWDSQTEMSRLNRAPSGTPLRVSARLHRLLEEAWAMSRATGGAFDPVVGPLIDAWDLRGRGRQPSPAELRRARARSGRPCFRLGSDRRVTPTCDGAWIDAGAFGKGAALRRARGALGAADVRAALLDFGGQLLAMGHPPGRTAWSAAVAHPADRGRPSVRLRLRDRSAATTSSSERFVVVDGEPRGHVIDPRTGRPVAAWGSVTVVAADPLRADALATGLFVMGPVEGWRWAQGREDVGVLFLVGADEGEPPGACWNAAMEAFLAAPPARRDGCPGVPGRSGDRVDGATTG